MQSSIITDQLAYMRAYAPRFPEEDSTNLDKEFERLIAMVTDFENSFAGDRQWLTVSISEIEQARAAYLAGDDSSGEKLLSSASDHLKMAATGKRPRAKYIVTPDGEIDGRS